MDKRNLIYISLALLPFSCSSPFVKKAPQVEQREMLKINEQREPIYIPRNLDEAVVEMETQAEKVEAPVAPSEAPVEITGANEKVEEAGGDVPKIPE